MPKDGLGGDSVGKALQALQLLGRRESLRVTDLSAELGVAVSTAHRLLATLSHHGFAEQDPATRAYLLGPAAIGLSRELRRDHNLLPAARPVIEQLNAELDETVNLIVLDGPDAFFIDGVQSRKALLVGARTGGRVPAYTAAGGKVLLSDLPFDRVAARYPAGPARITRSTVPDLAALERELRTVRARGYALNMGEHVPDLHAVGVRVHGSYGVPIAAVTVAVPSQRWKRKDLVALVPRLWQAANSITESLGAAPGR